MVLLEQQWTWLDSRLRRRLKRESFAPHSSVWIAYWYVSELRRPSSRIDFMSAKRIVAVVMLLDAPKDLRRVSPRIGSHRLRHLHC